LLGITQIQCFPNQEWSADLGNTQCIPIRECPPDMPAVSCFIPPCLLATCPGVPEAACFDNLCGGCNYDYFVNGRKIDLQDCNLDGNLFKLIIMLTSSLQTQDFQLLGLT